MMKNNNENKSERFKRLAEKRTRRVLEDMRILSNLSNKGLYEYTPDQLRRIFGAVRESLVKAEGRFKGVKEPESEFKL